ncbi:MAG: glucosidase [Cytophagales bacterium]|nr:glucosidase [Cytophagales bacterium]
MGKRGSKYKFGPYLSERQWGTVREDYSEHGTAWEFFPHDHARSRTYRWGEDGIAGISDDRQLMCFALAMWNGHDDILKERLFGLTGTQGNHNEDVKELYYYLDNHPQHIYMKYLYKYPTKKYDYWGVVEPNLSRNVYQPEYEIYDTGCFNQNSYFNITIEYAKADHEDILIKITAQNMSTEDAILHLVPTLWCRNTWSWAHESDKPLIKKHNETIIICTHPVIGNYYLHTEAGTPLFCDNETNAERLFGLPGASAYPKDAFHNYIVKGDTGAVNPLHQGTKSCIWIAHTIAPKKEKILRLRLKKSTLKQNKAPFQDFDALFMMAKNNCDLYYSNLQKNIPNTGLKDIQKLAWSGLMWGKMYYEFNVKKWLYGDERQHPPSALRLNGRNAHWQNIDNHDIISMPDKWEYPWYAAWDLAFHCIPIAQIDPDFAIEQMLMFLEHRYMNAQGALPAYEWAYGDTNPPVHLMGILKILEIADELYPAQLDISIILSKALPALTKNFAWWTNIHKHPTYYIYKGGFLGLDNVSAIDRGRELPKGQTLYQSDATGWMAAYALQIAKATLMLNPNDTANAHKYISEFIAIATDLNDKLWLHDTDFYHDIIFHEDGTTIPLKCKSIVGFIPMAAIETISLSEIKAEFVNEIKNLCDNNLSYRSHIVLSDTQILFTAVPLKRLPKLLFKLCHEQEFLAPFGIRSLSKEYAVNPYIFEIGNQKHELRYHPAESLTTDFGENSNWRGPVWMPVNYVIIEALYRLHGFYGDDFAINFPSNTSKIKNLEDIAKNIIDRLASIFLDSSIGRPIYSGHNILQLTPDINQHILYYEYFNPDTGTGYGASHQTGWTSIIAYLIAKKYK